MPDSNDQLVFDFSNWEPVSVHGERIAAPVDDSLLEEESSDVSEEESVSEPVLPEEDSETVVSSQPDDMFRKLEQKERIFLQKDLQRAALAWLASDSPTAAAIRVPTRLAKFQADAAAFWSTPQKKRLLRPEKTRIVETRISRAHCWPDCAGSEDLLPRLREEKQYRSELEAEIRRTEPHLRDDDVLFPEFEYWNYAGTANRAYKACLRRIRDFEHALYRGSRFERIHRANVANELYLAVPENLITEDELADGWGLLYITKNLTVRMIKRAEHQECPLDNLLHLSQNIAASSLSDVLFANGISLNSDGSTSFRKLPKRRGKLIF